MSERVTQEEKDAIAGEFGGGVEEWIAEHGLQYVDTLGGYGVKLKRSSELKYPYPEYVSVDDLRALLSGMALVPVERTFEAGARAFKKLMIEASHAAIHPHIEGVYGVFEHKLAATEGI